MSSDAVKARRPGAALIRRRLFAAAWLKRRGEDAWLCAQEAGYRGQKHSLEVTASRLLKHAEVRAIISAKVEKAEERAGVGMAEAEILRRLTLLASLPDTDTVDVFDFISLITPAKAVAGVKAAENLEEAKAVVKMAGVGFYIDLDKAKAAGLGRFVKEISHDPETGAPRLKLQDNLQVKELARKALVDLAKIKGLMREEAPAPPPSNVTLNLVLAQLPTDALAAINRALEEQASKARAITVEASGG